MDITNNIPVVTFFLKTSVLREVTGKTIADVALQAHVHNPELWPEIEKKLDGLQVSSADNLQSEIVGVLQDRLDQTSHELGQMRKSARETNMELLQSTDLLQAEVVRLKSTLTLKEAELSVLKEQVALLKEAMKL